jgi:hypothetical protein
MVETHQYYHGIGGSLPSFESRSGIGLKSVTC